MCRLFFVHGGGALWRVVAITQGGAAHGTEPWVAMGGEGAEELQDHLFAGDVGSGVRGVRGGVGGVPDVVRCGLGGVGGVGGVLEIGAVRGSVGVCEA